MSMEKKASYSQKNTQHCTHQGTKPPPQAFKHCLATMQARDRKQGSRARETFGSGVSAKLNQST